MADYLRPSSIDFLQSYFYKLLDVFKKSHDKLLFLFFYIEFLLRTETAISWPQNFFRNELLQTFVN